MEDYELQRIWRSVDTNLKHKSEQELNLLLTSKTRHTINKFLVLLGISLLTCIGLLVFLAVATYSRKGDLIYLINNAVIGLITIVSLVSGLRYWDLLHNNKYNQPLSEWLGNRINLISNKLTGKNSYIWYLLVPLMNITIGLSIHVLYAQKTMIEVLNTEESVYGLIFGTTIGSLVSFYGINKLRRYQLKNLMFLKDLHRRLTSVQ